MTALVSGASGLVGAALLPQLPGARVLSRDPERARLSTAAAAFAWNPEAGPPPAAALDGVEAIFHLAGEPVAEGRWTAAKKRKIRISRVAGTRHLVAGLAALARRPKVLVSASAVGYYGDRGDQLLDESSAAGSGFLAEVCAEWEREALAATALGVRVVCARFGVVLARQGGALARLLPPFKLGAGARLGDGRQWMPWVHLDDIVGLLLHARDNPTMSGPLNAVAPEPVTNATFTRALGQALGRPTLLAVPALALRLGLGEMSQSLTASQRVVPAAAVQTGYRFRYPSLEPALASLIA